MDSMIGGVCRRCKNRGWIQDRKLHVGITCPVCSGASSEIGKAFQQFQQIGTAKLAEPDWGGWILTKPLSQWDIEDLENRYKLAVWVYVAVRVITQSVMRVSPPVAFRLDSKGEKHELDFELLDMPTLDPDGNVLERGREFFGLGTAQLMTSGEVYIWRQMGGKFPINLRRLDPRWVDIVPDRRNKLMGYIYSPPSGAKVGLLPEEIVHVKLPNNPFSNYYPLAPLEAGQTAIKADTSAGQFSEMLYKSGGVYGGIVTASEGTSNEEGDRLRAEFSALIRGPGKAFRVGVLRGAERFDTISMTPREMSIIESRKLSREEILALFGVPKILASIETLPSRATAFAETQQFWKVTILPLLKLWEEAFTIGVYRELPDVIVEFDISGIEELGDSMADIAEVATSLTNSGVMTINELRARLKLEPVSYGNSFFSPITAIPVENTTPPGGPSKKQSEGMSPPSPDAPPPPLSGPQGGPQLTIWTPPGGPHIRKQRSRHAADRFAARIQPFENRLLKRIVGFFERREKEMLRNVRGAFRKQAGDIEFILRAIWFDEDTAIQELIEILGAEETAALVREAEFVAASFGVRGRFDIVPLHVQEYIREKIFKGSPLIIETTVGGLRDVLSEAITQGQSIDTLADVIRFHFDPYVDGETWMARRIARTEIVGAANAGGLFGMQEAGIERKKWTTARDEKVREAHLAAEAQGPIGLNETWNVGGWEMMFPGDPSAGPEQVVNCRCVEIAVE